MAQTVERLPARRETRVRVPPPGQEEPLEEETAAHSTTMCLGNSRDGGAWRATVHGVAKRPTRLSDLTFTDSSAIRAALHKHVLESLARFFQNWVDFVSLFLCPWRNPIHTVDRNLLLDA